MESFYVRKKTLVIGKKLVMGIYFPNNVSGKSRMGFDQIGEVLHNPLHKFKLEEKQLAVSATIVLLWKYWDQHWKNWIANGEIDNLYIGTLQREQVTGVLLCMDTGVFGRTA